MRWDSSRPVPWQRLVREWLVYVALMVVVLFLVFRDSGVVGALAGLLVSGPLYLLFGFVMAKLGYQRRTLKDMRTPRAGRDDERSDDDDDRSDGPVDARDRPRPAPTRRTSGGGQRPRSRSRRR